ncbi:MAG: GNAT family N-acetyltransferase [Tumebacillaceae bacterium]
MNIRVLTAEDAPIYWERRLSALKENPEAFATTYEEAVARPNPVEGMAKRLEDGENGFTLGAFDEQGALVGVVTFMREQQTKTRHKGNVVAVYVAPETRGQGVARALMLDLIERVKGLGGVEQIHLAVNAANEPARRLYKNVGFEVFGFEKNALKHEGKSYDDEWMMLRLI